MPTTERIETPPATITRTAQGSNGAQLIIRLDRDPQHDYAVAIHGADFTLYRTRRSRRAPSRAVEVATGQIITQSGIACMDGGGAPVAFDDPADAHRAAAISCARWLCDNLAPFDELPGHIDRPSYGHLGRKINFADLPEACQRCVLADYRALWGL